MATCQVGYTLFLSLRYVFICFETKIELVKQVSPQFNYHDNDCVSVSVTVTIPCRPMFEKLLSSILSCMYIFKQYLY